MSAVSRFHGHPVLILHKVARLFSFGTEIMHTVCDMACAKRRSSYWVEVHLALS